MPWDDSHSRFREHALNTFFLTFIYIQIAKMKCCNSTVAFWLVFTWWKLGIAQKGPGIIPLLNGTLTPKKDRIYIFKKSRAKKYCITKQTLTKEEKKLAPLAALVAHFPPIHNNVCTFALCKSLVQQKMCVHKGRTLRCIMQTCLLYLIRISQEKNILLYLTSHNLRGLETKN